VKGYFAGFVKAPRSHAETTNPNPQEGQPSS
jgi:hypothetical protein